MTPNTPSTPRTPHTFGRSPAGLSSDEAARRLQAQGFNEIEDRETQGLLATLRGVLTEPMFLLLLSAAALYLLLGDLGEGLLLAFFALVSVGLVILQERRSEHALQALRVLAAPQARVLRDGKPCRVPARELVLGDAILVAEGERIPADARLLECNALAVDESLLTGESVPVHKRPNGPDDAGDGDGSEATLVHAGTLVVGGHGLAEVVATGQRTRVGQIGASLAGIESVATPLQLQLRRLVQVFGLFAAGVCTLLTLWWGLVRGDWLQGLLSSIALGMAMLPEEFPMALAVFLALGAWRLARIQVLARRPAVIEALGGATLLCVDKTGTLTENRMQLRRLVSAEADIEVRPGDALPESVHRLLEFAMLASRRGGLDPMDRALLGHGDAALADTEHLHPDWQLSHEYPLSAELLAMSNEWSDAQGQRFIAAKGAPEAVLDLCHLDATQVAAEIARVRRLADQGLRVLAVAEGRIPAGQTIAQQHDYDFRLLGLVAFEDPLRPSVAPALQLARQAGIAVAMITGDHSATALAIGAQAGLDVQAGALSGADIDQLDHTALAKAMRSVRIFARVTPQQKLRLVQAARSNGETVAMTGDGVNDAPALKAAHIGIAMGKRGTDVAREAAGLVLLDEDFGRIVGGVRMGRRIFDNLRKVMTYITAIHVPVAGLALLPLLLGLPPLLLPAHVVLTEMVIDPVCSLAFEGAPEDPRVMQRPPRRAGEGLIGLPLLVQGLTQGLALLAATLIIYITALQAGRAEDLARTLAVVGLTFGNLLLVAVNASVGSGWRAMLGRSAIAFWSVSAVATAALAVALVVPAARHLLHFEAPTAADLGLGLLVVAASVAVGAIAAAALSAGLARHLQRRIAMPLASQR